MQNLLEYANYKTYLRAAIDAKARGLKGVRSRFAEALQCQPGYVTQVLDGLADLSADQASAANAFFGHTGEESDYFLVLVLRARAGTPALRAQLDKQIAKFRTAYLDLKNRLKAPRIAPVDETIFYGNWQFVAILSLVAVPGFQSKEAIAARLDLPLTLVAKRVDQLKGMGLLVQKGSRFTHGPAHTHLPKDSPMNARHQQSWRLRAMRSIERENDADFHYSSVVTLSVADRDAIKNVLIEMIQRAARIVAPSPAEVICGLGVDFFEV